MSPTGRTPFRLAACLALPLLLGGCPGAEVKRVGTDKDLLESRQYAQIADRPAPCTGPAQQCVQAQEIRAEACRQLAAAVPAGSPERRQRLDCAVQAYRAAVEGRGTAADRKLLLNLATAANDAVTASAGDVAAQAEAEWLGAQGLLRGNPADPEGCYFAGSSRLAAALLQPAGPGRCPVLAQVPPSCAGAAAPAGRSDQARMLAGQLTSLRQRSQCP